MNDESLVTSKPEEAGPSELQSVLGEQVEASEATQNVGDSPLSSAVRVNGFGTDRSNGEPTAEKSDSEAETVVLSGKEDGKDNNSKKTIKLEELGGLETDLDGRSENAKKSQDDKREGSAAGEIRKPSLKRKRAILEQGHSDDPEGANSSNLSSTISSPVQEARSSKATDTASNRSRSSPPSEDPAQGQDRRAHKARNGANTTNKYRGGGRGDPESASVNRRKKRETRSATHFDGPTQRSESPPSRSNKRAASIQSNLPQAGLTKRRRAPATLHVERRRKASEDTHPESEDDSSIHSHHHLQKLTSTDNEAVSSAKMISHKKNRDRNGRTLLARACQQGSLVEVEKWLKERPQDIDVPDNAGNTPLQIAALDGKPDIVRLLLNAKCDIDCKNIDKDTPLIDAVENGHLEVVEMLLKVGLDPRQTNAFGKEPLDLVKAESDRADEIREALQASKKEKASVRRPSEDFNRQHSAGLRDVEPNAGAGPGGSPVNSTRSPPPAGAGARRRTARSQPTDDALLWVNATPARLRDAAGKGDLTIVDHILKMRPRVDTESVLAAARGGHDDVLNLMLAIATPAPDPDPEPLRSGEYKPAYSTPMLAAIGHGNTTIINLLLAQPGFDPTRRLYKGMTYYELAKERQGADWQEEYDILKEAYDKGKRHGGRKSNDNSPRKVRPRRADSSKSGSEPSSSPHEPRKTRKPNTLKEEFNDETKHDSAHRDAALTFGEEGRKQKSPSRTLDLELEPLGPPKPKANQGKAGGDKDYLTSKRADSLKPKRRLMSGNEVKTEQDIKRRASLAAETVLPKRKSGDSVLNNTVRQRRFSDASEPRMEVTLGATSSIDGAISKKRHRVSVSPQASKSDISGSADIKKNKRQRVDSQGSAIDQDRDRSFRPGAPAMVANMIASPASVSPPVAPQGTAPVAFMGSNVTSPVNVSPADLRPPSAILSPVNSTDPALPQRPEEEGLQVHDRAAESNISDQPMVQELERKVSEDESQALQAEEEKLRQAQMEQERQAQIEKDQAERQARIAREEEESRLEEQRQSAEAERQIRLEREQKEAHLAKLKRDEDMHRRRMEQEQFRKEELERRRRESEEREVMRQRRMQEEEERQYLQSLPNGLRRAAELSPEEARNTKEITKWLPLRTVTTQELNPSCEPQLAEERWIANIQAAPILAVRDLTLSQCKYHTVFMPIRCCPDKCADTAWAHIDATPNHRGSLWRQLRNCMSQAVPSPLLTPTEAFHLDEETKPKFFALQSVFWMKLSDFNDMVPRHPHLAGIHLKERAIVLHEFPFGKGGSWDRPAFAGVEGAVKQEAHSPVMNGFR